MKIKKNISETFSISSLKVGDVLFIKTKNSLYKFRITKPDKGEGILSGGDFGFREEHRAVLICSMQKPLETLKDKVIKINASVAFLLEIGKELLYVYTSSVESLKMIRDINNCHYIQRSLAS
jgi:hypothetical protein